MVIRMKNVEVLAHSAICITSQEGKKLYFDPFHVKEERNDADVIFVSHPHYDHYSVEDISKVMTEKSLLVAPLSCKGVLENLPVAQDQVIYLQPWEETVIAGFPVTAVPAYNVGKQFHTQDKLWLGYKVLVDGLSYFVMGDTDANEDNLKVDCDVLLIPVGGKYTFSPEEAAAYTRKVQPRVEVIPTHFGDIVGSADAGETFLQLIKE